MRSGVGQAHNSEKWLLVLDEMDTCVCEGVWERGTRNLGTRNPKRELHLVTPVSNPLSNDSLLMQWLGLSAVRSRYIRLIAQPCTCKGYPLGHLISLPKCVLSFCWPWLLWLVPPWLWPSSVAQVGGLSSCTHSDWLAELVPSLPNNISAGVRVSPLRTCCPCAVT